MGNGHTFLWQNQVMTDLNALVPANSPFYLMWAFGINEAGEIAGMAVETSTGDVHAFLATPIKVAAAASANDSAEAPRTTAPIVLPDSARKLLRRRVAMIGW